MTDRQAFAACVAWLRKHFPGHRPVRVYLSPRSRVIDRAHGECTWSVDERRCVIHVADDQNYEQTIDTLWEEWAHYLRDHLPACLARTSAADGSLRCEHPRVRLSRITAATCRRCPWSDEPPPRPGPATLVDILACPHRGLPTGARLPDELCGCQGRDEPVYGCALHGTCTLRRVSTGPGRPPDCLGCAERPAG